MLKNILCNVLLSSGHSYQVQRMADREADNLFDGGTDEFTNFDGQTDENNEADANLNSTIHDTTISEDQPEDPDLEVIKARVREMEEEAEKLKQMQSEVEKQMNMSPPAGVTSPLNLSFEEKMEVDSRSVFVGNVDYGATAEELEQHFHGCGSINRVTILCDKYSGHPKGFAYVEFTDKDSTITAMALDESLFRGRQIKVGTKRTNKPGISTTNRPPRGRGYRGRGSGRGGGFFAGFRPTRRPFRSRRASWFTPY